jgi:hypothetical protein
MYVWFRKEGVNHAAKSICEQVCAHREVRRACNGSVLAANDYDDGAGWRHLPRTRAPASECVHPAVRDALKGGTTRGGNSYSRGLNAESRCHVAPYLWREGNSAT